MKKMTMQQLKWLLDCLYHGLSTIDGQPIPFLSPETHVNLVAGNCVKLNQIAVQDVAKSIVSL